MPNERIGPSVGHADKSCNRRNDVGGAAIGAPPWLRTSGDLRVDRRFLYARAATAAGDHGAAAEILEQTLELAPGWAPLWLAAAEAREKLGRIDAAIEAYARAEALDSSGVLGVALHLARIGRRAPPEVAPANYVRALFDDYADRFDTHLIGRLSYRGHELLRKALERLGATEFSVVVDLGCGTGLCGAQFRGISRTLAGVDLASRMIEVVRAKKIYDRLVVGSDEAFLAAEPAGSVSLVLAADVLVYTGDLAPILAAVRRTLSPGGKFAFTLQLAESGSYRVGADLRYAHSATYVQDVARIVGLRVELLEEATTRSEAGVAVAGFVVVLTKPD
jgi:predicted TPR repeat methyltransferase